MLDNFNNMKLSFEGSILGFENLDMFLLETVEDTPFAYLKSLEDENISFLVTSPFQWYGDYEIKLSESLKNKLQIMKPEDTLVLNIVTIRGDLRSSTVNLLAPLIININKFIGSQYVVQEKTKFRTDCPLIMSHIREEGEGE
ncbi:flagellar assembly protein FliW [Paenibacillus sediminis]|uniref:Flagellar assembly factor FliW n=1 Tax=Paenibacillus sediminis TaxID=664909 RepID=A0ABS4H297_9BACL|nr:flagellar assembly protein FliW [Paenibacillus sediminis]MBP1936660.1 flagellar assembly factor FliW [Paenibacillus sediminis]